MVWPPVSLGSQEAFLVLKKKNLAHHESVLLEVKKNGLSLHIIFSKGMGTGGFRGPSES